MKTKSSATKIVAPGIVSHPSRSCLFSSLVVVLRSLGFHYSETDLYFFCGGLNVEYRGSLDHIGGATVEKIGERLAKIGIDVRYLDNDRPRTLVKNLFDALRDGSVVLLFVQSSDLDYHETYRDNVGRPHFVILYGMDLDENVAYVFDNHIREYSGQNVTFSGTLPLQAVVKSVEKAYSISARDASALTPADVAANVRSSLEAYLEGSTVQTQDRVRVDTALSRIWPSWPARYRYYDNVHYYGILAQRKYLEDFDRLASLPRESFSQTCATINYNIRVSCYMQILDYLVAFLNESRFDDESGPFAIENELKTIYTEWDKLGLRILKAGLRGQAEKIPEIAVKASEILLRQERAFADLATFLT